MEAAISQLNIAAGLAQHPTHSAGRVQSGVSGQIRPARRPQLELLPALPLISYARPLLHLNK
jgi:hypothetical protein